MSYKLFIVQLFVISSMILVSCSNQQTINKEGEIEQNTVVINTDKWTSKLEEMSMNDIPTHIYDKEYLENRIKNIYLDNANSLLRSICAESDTLYSKLPYTDVKQYDEGYIITYLTEDSTFRVLTDEIGIIKHMLYYIDELPDKDLYSLIKEGQTYEELKTIFPAAILQSYRSELLFADKVEMDKTQCEIIFSNGEIGVIYFDYKKGKYVVNDKEIAVFKFDESTMNLLK